MWMLSFHFKTKTFVNRINIQCSSGVHLFPQNVLIAKLLAPHPLQSSKIGGGSWNYYTFCYILRFVLSGCHF